MLEDEGLGSKKEKDGRKMKGEKRDRQTAEQSCQPLRKSKIRKREERKGLKNVYKMIIK